MATFGDIVPESELVHIALNGFGKQWDVFVNVWWAMRSFLPRRGYGMNPSRRRSRNFLSMGRRRRNMMMRRT